MTDGHYSSARLVGGPCDGELVAVQARTWAIIMSRDNPRFWMQDAINAGDPSPVLIANEAYLYVRDPEQQTFTSSPQGLKRSIQDGRPTWDLVVTEPS